MSKKTLLLGAIASIIAINSVFADTTVTSKTYVDNQDEALYNELDEIKQDIIPAADTNYEANGGGVTVVTYTENAGVLGERYICDADAEENGDCDGDNLVTRDLISQATSLPTTGALDGRCEQWDGTGYMDDEHCLLWRLTHRDVFGGVGVCGSDSDCDSYCSCINGICGNCVEQ